MLYAAQLEDGDNVIATIIHAENDEEAYQCVEQWLDIHEWEPEAVWQYLKIWRLGEQISDQVLHQSFK